MKILWPSVANIQTKYIMLNNSSIRVCQTEMAITIPSSLNNKLSINQSGENTFDNFNKIP